MVSFQRKNPRFNLFSDQLIRPNQGDISVFQHVSINKKRFLNTRIAIVAVFYVYVALNFSVV